MMTKNVAAPVNILRGKIAGILLRWRSADATDAAFFFRARARSVLHMVVASRTAAEGNRFLSDGRMSQDPAPLVPVDESGASGPILRPALYPGGTGRPRVICATGCRSVDLTRPSVDKKALMAAA